MMKRNQMIFLTAALISASLSLGASCYAQENSQETKAEESAAAQQQVATAEEMAEPVEILDEGMTPVYGEDIQDGEYSIEVASSSSMFKIEECTLTVKDGEMSAVMTMGGTGYLKLYMGTGEEAVNASEEDYIPYVETEDGRHTFEIPVEALDKAIDCTAFSKKKEKWYDRQLVFQSASLPQDAFKNLQLTTLESLNLEDGTYQVEVTLEGGSGKSTVASPTELTIADGEAVAVIGWASPYYDYMIVDDQKYMPVNTEGDSVFEIPVTGFDWKMPVIADTIAMSTPHEISYTLYFDSSSIEKAE